MRARRREINIFNMSLLDILCGALGAFCFMMLVALPYYKPPGSAPELKKAQEETARLMHDLEQMKEQMRDPKSAEDMSALLERLKAQVQALQGQVNILTAEKEELQRRADQLTAEKQQLATEKQALQAKNQELDEANQKLQALLAAKKPFTIMARADDSSQGLDVIIFKSSLVEKGPVPLFADWVKGQYDNMHTLRNAMLYGSGLGLFVSGDSPPGSEAKIFLRLTNPAETRRRTVIEGAIVGDEMLSAPVRLPKVTLYPERFWVLLGTMTIDQNFQARFQEAAAAEREAAWQTLIGSTPPPTPTPTPPPTAAERAAAEAQRAAYEAQRAKLRETHKKFTQLLRLPIADESGKNEAEILQLTEDLLKDLPPRDHLREEVQFRRDRALEMKAKREGSPSPKP